MNHIFEVVTCVIELLVIYFYFQGVLGKKEGIGMWFPVSFVIAIGTHTARSYCYLSFGWNVGISVLLFLVISCAVFKGSYGRKIFFVAVQTIVMLVAEILTATLLSAVFPIEYDDMFTMRYAGMLMTTSLLFLLDIYIIYLTKRKYRQLPLRYNILLILCPIISVFLLLLLDFYIAQAQHNYYVAVFGAVLGLGYLNVMVFHFFDYYEKSLQVASMDAMLKANETNYVLLEENERELHILRHDIMKHVHQIKEMLSQQDNQDAKQYMAELDQIVSDGVGIARTGNLTLDTVLNIGKKKASAKGILMDTKLHILSDIKISSVDLTGVLYNVIDNAIEACDHLERKYILVSVVTEEDRLKITVENTAQEVRIENNTIKSTKGISGHGYGLVSVRKTLESYQGHMSLEYSEGVFTCRILMNNCLKN